MTDTSDPIRISAEERVDARRRFQEVVAGWLIVAVVTTFAWLLTSGPGSYFWPAWPMFGVGIAVFVKGLRLAGARLSNRESSIEREMERLRARP